MYWQPFGPFFSGNSPRSQKFQDPLCVKRDIKLHFHLLIFYLMQKIITVALCMWVCLVV